MAKFMKRQFHQTTDEHRIILTISETDGSYRPAPRPLIMETWLDHAPQTVAAQTGAVAEASAPLSHLSAEELAKAPRGWSFAAGLLTVKTADTFAPVQFTIDR